MAVEYFKHPTSTKMLIDEFKRASDDYLGRKITEAEFQYIVRYWADNCGSLIFQGPNDYLSSFKQRTGEKRIKLLESMLQGHQRRISFN